MVTKKCVICDQRPARTEKGYCLVCDEQIRSARRKRQPEKPERYMTYRGHVVGLFRNGGGQFTTRLLKRNPDKLPKSKTLNLNNYLDGFTREQIKKMKRAILQLANA